MEEDQLTLQPNRDSGSTRKKKLQHEIEIEDNQYNDQWNSCCSKTGTTDRRLIEFSCRMVLSTIALSVSLYSLVVAGPCDPLIPFWSSIIAFVLGLNVNNNPREKK